MRGVFDKVCKDCRGNCGYMTPDQAPNGFPLPHIWHECSWCRGTGVTDWNRNDPIHDKD